MNGRTKVERICKRCHKKFKIHYCLYKKGLGKFCSVSCSNTYKNKNILCVTNKRGKVIKCKNCGTEFYSPKSNIDRGNKFCCLDCSHKHYSFKHTAIRICKKCHKKFLIKRSALTRQDPKRRSGKFCSKKCMDSFRTIKRITKTCKKCGKKFKVKRSDRNANLFCSRVCNLKHGAVSSLEIIVAKILRKMKVKFVSQKCIKIDGLWTHVDFFVKPNVCLYIDGDYWHSFPDAKKRDKRNNIKLRLGGYRVIRIQESQMKKGKSFYTPILRYIKKLNKNYAC